MEGYRIEEAVDKNGPSLKRPYRPYAYKEKSYEFESEVRIVFRIQHHPNSPPGVLVDIDPRVLLAGGEVVISPYLQCDEGHALKELVKQWLDRGVPKLPLGSNSSEAAARGFNITVRRSAKREAVEEDDDEFVASLPPLWNECSKRFGMELGLPDLLQEL